MSPQSSTLNYRRLLLVGIGLPALLALVNHLLLREEYEGVHLVPSPVLFAFYVAQVGLVSWAAARFLQPWPLRWIISTWMMILLDLQLATLTSGHSVEAIDCLASAIIAGQLGIFIVWGVLGSGPFVWRLPAWIVIAVILWNLFWVLVDLGKLESRYRYFIDWNALLLVQAGLLIVLCGILRLCGFSLRIVVAESDATQGKPAKASFQFGIRDVLMWTTALAVLLAIAKAGDLLTLRYVKQIYAHGFLFVFTIAISTAAVLIVALWASLGQAHLILRILVLFSFSLLVGSGLAAYCNIVGKPLITSGRGPYWLHHFYGAGYWWIAWMFLSGALLGASLIIYRELGYRLVRDARRRWTLAAAAKS